MKYEISATITALDRKLAKLSFSNKPPNIKWISLEMQKHKLTYMMFVI